MLRHLASCKKYAVGSSYSSLLSRIKLSLERSSGLLLLSGLDALSKDSSIALLVEKMSSTLVVLPLSC
jgi:hypothetical protein